MRAYKRQIKEPDPSLMKAFKVSSLESRVEKVDTRHNRFRNL